MRKVILTCHSDDKCDFDELLVVEDQVLGVLIIRVPRGHLEIGECLLVLDPFCTIQIGQTSKVFSSLNSQNLPTDRRMNHPDPWCRQITKSYHFNVAGIDLSRPICEWVLVKMFHSIHILSSAMMILAFE